eukprot:s2958_g6.t1
MATIAVISPWLSNASNVCCSSSSGSSKLLANLDSLEAKVRTGPSWGGGKSKEELRSELQKSIRVQERLLEEVIAMRTWSKEAQLEEMAAISQRISTELRQGMHEANKDGLARGHPVERGNSALTEQRKECEDPAVESAQRLDGDNVKPQAPTFSMEGGTAELLLRRLKVHWVF